MHTDTETKVTETERKKGSRLKWLWSKVALTMATGWIKLLQCKSKAFDDVVHHRRRRSFNCKSNVQGLIDILDPKRKAKGNKPKPTKLVRTPPFKPPVSRKPEPASKPPLSIRTRSCSSESFFPSLTELPTGHSSRNVVEIIFHTSWGGKSFSGRVEMVFKIQNSPRIVTRFEEYREVVKSRASCTAMAQSGDEYARCAADGNEVMRFFYLGATFSGSAFDTRGGAWAFHNFKGAGVRTFSWSGAAHENGGGDRGWGAMLLCRVIAGRVCKLLGIDSLLEGRVGYDSAAGRDGELLAFDSGALLPCFLIIYKL